MKYIKFANLLFLLNWIYWVSYNFYFGWNWKPINTTEKLCDDLFIGFTYLAVGVYFYPLLKVYVKYIKDFDSKEQKHS